MWSKKCCAVRCLCPVSLGLASALMYVLVVFIGAYMNTGDLPWVAVTKIEYPIGWYTLISFFMGFFLALFYDLFSMMCSKMCKRSCGSDCKKDDSSCSK